MVLEKSPLARPASAARTYLAATTYAARTCQCTCYCMKCSTETTFIPVHHVSMYMHVGYSSTRLACGTTPAACSCVWSKPKYGLDRCPSKNFPSCPNSCPRLLNAPRFLANGYLSALAPDASLTRTLIRPAKQIRSNLRSTSQLFFCLAADQCSFPSNSQIVEPASKQAGNATRNSASRQEGCLPSAPP